jgi:hypothetical protein
MLRDRRECQARQTSPAAWAFGGPAACPPKLVTRVCERRRVGLAAAPLGEPLVRNDSPTVSRTCSGIHVAWTSTKTSRLKHCCVNRMAEYQWKTFATGTALSTLALVALFGPPTVVSPYPALIAIAAFSVGYAVVAFPAVVFWAWSPQLFTGEASVPRRSSVLLSVLTVLTPAYFGAFWEDGVKYDGLGYVVAVALLNAAILVCLWIWLRRAKSHPSFATSLTFHALLFGWLAWCAFPNLGELP